MADVGDLFGLQHIIDRHKDRANPGNGEAHGHKSMRITREQRNLVADPDAMIDKGRADPIAQGIEFGITPGHIPANDRRLGRITLRRSSQEAGNRMPPRRQCRHSFSPQVPGDCSGPPATGTCRSRNAITARLKASLRSPATI